MTQLSHNEQVIFPFQKIDKLEVLKTGFYHYNILRPLWIIAKKRPILYLSLRYPNAGFWGMFGVKKSRYLFIYEKWNYGLDYQWKRFLDTAHLKKAIVLVADKDTLIKRILTRQKTEGKEKARFVIKKPYPKKRWAFVYSILELPLIYELWCKELKKEGIEFVLLDAETYEDLHESIFVQGPNHRE